MARVSVYYLVPVLFWLCLGEVYQEKPAIYRGPEWPGSNIYASPQSWTSPRTTDDPLGATTDYDTVPVTTPQCNAGRRYAGSYPVGFRPPPDRPEDIFFYHLLEGEEATESQCLRECCSLGPLKCQYVWFFSAACVAVACHQDPEGSNCVPNLYAHLPPDMSTYVSMTYSTPVRTFTPPTTALITTSSLHHGNNPPTAIILPSNVTTHDAEIHLTAESTPNYYQGSLEYEWDLVLADPALNMEEVFMSGSTSESLHLSALSPGIYTVKLTVRDTVTGLTATATTNITVLPALSQPHFAINTPPQTNQEQMDGLQRTSIVSHTVTKTTKYDQTPTTSTDHHSPKPTATTLAQARLQTDQASSSTSSSTTTDYGLYLKVGVPVLSIVLLILSVSGCIVAVSSCTLLQPEKRRYRYRKLIYTDA